MEPIFRWICKHFHNEVFRPVRGEYRCAECLRTWPVQWDAESRPSDVAVPAAASAFRKMVSQPAQQ